MKVKIQDREYQFPELESISYREARIVKQLVGLRLGEFQEAFEAGDADMLVGLAAVAEHRSNGKDADQLKYLLDLKLDEIEFVVEEDDAGPPDEQQPPSQPGGSGSENDAA